jgi:hypothetical protein
MWRSSVIFREPPNEDRSDRAEIHAVAPEQEWQILSAFLGFIDRHSDDGILAITIHYR